MKKQSNTTYTLLTKPESFNFESISLPGRGSLRRVVKLSDIVWLEGRSNYTLFHLTDGSSILVSVTLARYDAFPGFLRIQKGYVVNQAHVTRTVAYKWGIADVWLSNGKVLSVGRRRAASVYSTLSTLLRS